MSLSKALLALVALVFDHLHCKILHFGRIADLRSNARKSYLKI